MDNESLELKIAEFEFARNEMVEAYFTARPWLVRNEPQQKLVEAGFRLGWEAYQNKEKLIYEASND